MNAVSARADKTWSHNKPMCDDQHGNTINQNGNLGNKRVHLAIPNNTVSENPTDIMIYQRKIIRFKEKKITLM
jgi:hypothetical protein